ncbi:TagK domain-containing protein [Scandinavium goeteborgense]|uniref:TagK domain-containing protein n=1 Tax=Scandinavium goeteborgense TaxID=1851514 RepID=UPI0037FCCC8A
MRLITLWPIADVSFPIEEHFTRSHAAFFDPQQGILFSASHTKNINAVLFYWEHPTLMVENLSAEYVCIINGEPLGFGSCSPLHLDWDVQIGQFRMTLKPVHSSLLADNVPLHGLLGEEVNNDPLAFSDIEQWLAERGTPGVNRSQTDVRDQYDENEPDVLKTLSEEYRRFLIWGEQDNGDDRVSTVMPQKFCAHDRNFDNVWGAMKNNTLTECILASPALIEKVCEELGNPAENEVDLFRDEKHDILHLLASDNSLKPMKKNIPILVLKEFYKTGLETLL